MRASRQGKILPMNRRAFLGLGCATAGAVAAAGLVPGRVAWSRVLGGPLPWVRFDRERACIGDAVTLQGWLGVDGPAELRLRGPAGWSETLPAQTVRGRVEALWRVARTAVPASAGHHPLRLEARSLPDGRWVAARRPLAVQIHRFAFGL